MGLLEEKLKGLFGYIEANTPRATRPVAKPSQVIDQGLFGGRIGQVPQRAHEMYQGLLNAPAELAALGGQEMNQSVRKELTQPRQANPKKWMDAGMELAGMAPVGGLVAHTVYHGSPHKFNKFDMSKIGTGEGAQAYGHGIYAAESPDVARSYMLAGTSGNMPTTIDKAGANVSGNFYKVDIPDEAIPRMLDWDKPLSEQAPEVRAAAKNLGITDAVNGEDLLWKIKRTKYGAREAMQGNTGIGDAGIYASEQLRQQGIPGIRYLDQASRGSGQGTSNFVLFDDQLPRILEVNGQPTGLLSYADEAAQKGGGLVGKAQPTKYELAHQVAQKNAVDMLGLPPNNTAMDRAMAMGAEPMYHGSASDIQQLDPAMYGSSTGAHSAKQAFWGVSDPTTAGGYAEYAATGAPVKRLLDQADQYEKAGNWDKYDEALAAAEKLEPELYNQPLRGQNIMPLMVMPRNPAVMDAKGAEFVDVEGGVNKFLRSAKLGGKDAAIFKNMSDDVGSNARPADHYAILDPSIVRSRFAAFDPARRNENDLLASLAPYIGIGGLLSLGLYGQDEQQSY